MELTSAQVSPVIESQSGSAAEASSGCAIIDSLSRWAKETPDKVLHRLARSNTVFVLHLLSIDTHVFTAQ
jgi:hypothetical protein